MILESTITCPKCGYQALEQMPTDACRFLYYCKSCREQLKPKSGGLTDFLYQRNREIIASARLDLAVGFTQRILLSA
jgi:hypothetical protein